MSLSIPPQSKKKIQGLKVRSVAKKSQSDIKTKIRKVKPFTALTDVQKGPLEEGFVSRVVQW
jgi:hypothetical protein